MIKLIKHLPNQHGYPVSLTRSNEEGEIQFGFVLNSLADEAAQDEYIAELSCEMDWQIEDHTK